MPKEINVTEKIQAILTELSMAKTYTINALNHNRDLQKLIKKQKGEVIKCL
jgi:hypothetical protein